MIRPNWTAATVTWGGLVFWGSLLGLVGSAVSQNRVRFPADVPPSLTVPPPNAFPPPQPSPWTSGPIVGQTVPPNGAFLGPQIQPFDPYAGAPPSALPGGNLPRFPSSPSAAPFPGQPVWNTAPPIGTGVAPLSTPFPPPPGGVPNLPPTGLPPADPYSAIPTSPWGPSAAPAGAFPNSPPQPIQPVPVFPNGLPWNQNVGPENRFFQNTGAAYTFLYGTDGDQLQINEVELFTSAVFKYFAHSGADLRVTPGFIFDFLDGPQDTTADLPAQLYSAYLDTIWRPQLAPQFLVDLSARVGVYSDFQTFNTHSIRITGRGLGIVQLTPTVALKAGVEYIDRVDLKLLPAGGILWEPDDRTIVDLYFPRPKIARYWTTWGNTDIWWHVGGEYGGGSWTIEREDDPLIGTSDRVDINDIRVYWGIEWDRLNGFDGLFQVGYVFDRELVYKEVPADNLSLDDTFMIRLGLEF